MHLMHNYEVRPRKDHRGIDLISDVLPFGRLWYGEPNAISNAIGYAKFFSRSHDAVIRVYERFELVVIFMLDRSLALRLRLGSWAASGEDSSAFIQDRSAGARSHHARALFFV